MTQYVSNHTPTSSLTGWTDTGDGALTATADGAQFKSTGTGSGRFVKIKLLTRTSGSGAANFTLSGVQIRRNTSSGSPLKMLFNDSFVGNNASFVSLNDTLFPVGQFVTVTNMLYQFSDLNTGSTDIYLLIYMVDGAAFDFTIKNVKFYDAGDNPAQIVLDSNDCQYTYTQGNNSLGATFTYTGGDEMVKTITWDWGDGSATVTGAPSPFTTGTYANVKAHYFPTAGRYTVKLTAASVGGVATVFSTQVVSVPSGTFTANFNTQASYLNLDVDASSSVAPSNDPVDTYTWNFGDSSTATGKLASHTYAQPGTYAVSLTISTNETLRTHTTTKSVVITAPPNPDNYFNITKKLLEVTFAPGIQNGTSYAWNFGDGATDTVQSPVHIYSAPGTYTVSLTVNGTLSTSQTITVSDVYTPIGKLNDALLLEVSVPQPAGSIYNRLPNPDGVQGSWGWITPVSGSTLIGSSTTNQPKDKAIPGSKLIYTSSGVGTQVFYSEAVTVTAGQYVGAQFNCTYVDGFYRVCVEALNAAGAVVGTGSQTGYLSALGTSQRTVGYLVPAGATQARLRVNHYSNTSAGTPAGGKILQLRHMFLGQASTAAALTTNPYLDYNNWQNILGPTSNIEISRSELDVGTVQIHVLDASLDPAISDTIRPGQGVRLRVNTPDPDGNSVLEALFTGTIRSADVDYGDVLKKGVDKSTEITLSASNNITQLAQAVESRGVALISELPEILEGKGVPFMINGSSGQVPTVNVVSINDNASALDQIAVTRDSNAGYAYVDRNNVLQARDPQNMPTVPVGVIDEQAYAPGVGASFSTSRCMNSVTIKWLRTTGTGTDTQTQEIPYGPYQDLTSIAEWGLHPAEFVMHGLENPTNIAAAAQAILDANAVPQQHIDSVTLPIRYVEDLHKGKALLDLYDLVQLKYDRTQTDELARVTGVKHSITPDRWTMELDFDVDGAVASPQVVASPPVAVITGKYSDQAALSANYTTTGTATDIPGMTLTVPVSSSSQVFVVAVSLDIKSIAAGTANFIGQLVVGGTTNGRQFVVNSPLTGLRLDSTQMWYITGLTPGNVVFKVNCRSDNTATNTWQVSQPHSAMTIWEV